MLWPNIPTILRVVPQIPMTITHVVRHSLICLGINKIIRVEKPIIICVYNKFDTTKGDFFVAFTAVAQSVRSLSRSKLNEHVFLGQWNRFNGENIWPDFDTVIWNIASTCSNPSSTTHVIIPRVWIKPKGFAKSALFFDNLPIWNTTTWMISMDQIISLLVV